MQSPQVLPDEDIKIIKPTKDKPEKNALRSGGAETPVNKIVTELTLDKKKPVQMGTVSLPKKDGVKSFKVFIKTEKGAPFKPVGKGIHEYLFDLFIDQALIQLKHSYQKFT